MSRVDLVKLGERLRDYGMDGCEASLSVRETLALADLIDTIPAAQPTSEGEEREAFEEYMNGRFGPSWRRSFAEGDVWDLWKAAARSAREGGK